MEFKLDRRPLAVTTFAEQARTNRALVYGLGRPAEERVAVPWTWRPTTTSPAGY